MAEQETTAKIVSNSAQFGGTSKKRGKAHIELERKGVRYIIDMTVEELDFENELIEAEDADMPLLRTMQLSGLSRLSLKGKIISKTQLAEDERV